jgi:Carboxypeptidase regulatory-like domain
MTTRFRRDSNHAIGMLAWVFAVSATLVWASAALGQTTISAGSIRGLVTDPTGAVVPHAAITVTNRATGAVLHTTTNGSGNWDSGALLPDHYRVVVAASGFKTTEIGVDVQVGVTSSANVTLQVGNATTMVTVEAPAEQVNTEQATVQQIINPKEINQLPVNGRNFLDLASLSPGVQIQDGMSFDPTKTGFSSVSFAGRFGRTARIEMDGLDMSDETVGTTTMNVPMSGIDEMQVEQSTLDISTELTSSGALNLTSKSGTDEFHGQGFFYGRWHNTAARIADNDLFWRRAQWGVNIGGPIVKDKLFFFADWERNRQDLFTPVELAAPFTSLTGGYNGPFREQMLQGRLDWTINSKWRAFGRWLYNRNTDVSAFTSNSFSPFLNEDNTPDYAAGLDGTTGRFTHSIRFGFLHFDNAIADAVGGSGITDPAPPVEIGIGGTFGPNFASGPNLLAPQATLQHDVQIKYDGTVIFGTHLLRYGIGVNDIQGGGYAKFFGLAPDVIVPSLSPSTLAFAQGGPFPGGESNPLNYPATEVVFGNGQGFFTEIPNLGFPAGGQYDTRLNWYIGDTWKVKPNFTLTYGLHYVRDTGRSDSDLPAIPALNQFGPGLGNPVNQPNDNFSPIVGIAWQPWKNGKTVIRAGGGIYYENAIFNNVLFDRPARLQKGLFAGSTLACPGGSVALPAGGSIDTSSLCGQPIGSVASQLAADQAAYQAAVIAAGPQANGAFVGNTLAEGAASTGDNLIGPDYRSPRSYQMNAGFQHQFGTSSVLSVDFVRNVGVGYLLAYDTNHVGDARYLNQAAALNAINATNESFGCADGTAGINCAIAAGATIGDYGNNGLASGLNYLSGLPASGVGLTPSTGAAFAGINPNLGENVMLFPIGRSVYDGLQVSFRQNMQNPLPGVKAMSLIVSYALSRATSEAQDQDFVNTVTDQRNIGHYIGPNGLDRTDQLALGGVFDIARGFRLSFTGHFETALPVTLTVPSTGAPGDIFISDLTGDGTVGDVLPGTNIGSFGRDVKLSSLNSVISAYNSNVAGHLTPAGQALVNANLFTQAQLVALGGTAQPVAMPPAGQLANDSFMDTALQLSYLFRPSTRFETLTIEPRIGVYNLFNFANYGPLSGVLDGSAGSVDGTTQGLRVNRITLGTGLFGFGSPRAMEWGMQISF